MKSTLIQLVLITVISTMASLNVFAQKRFDNPNQKRKIITTKSGPKSAIAELWIPNDSTEMSQETLKAILHYAHSSARDQVTIVPNQSADHNLALADHDQPKRRGNRVIMKGSKIKEN